MRNVELIKKYGRIPMETPNMTSSSQNGWTTTGHYDLFNPNLQHWYYSDQVGGHLFFPTGKSAFINKILIPAANSLGQTNSWYSSWTFYVYMYYKGVQVFYSPFSISWSASQLISFAEVQVDQIYHTRGYGSGWDSSGDAWEDVQVGKKFYGYWAA